jgi:glycosyltransferase involved in cell wall biosynthesis
MAHFIHSYKNTMEKMISIVVPIHDPKGKQLDFLDEMLNSILAQSLLPLEVVLTSNHDLINQNKVLHKYIKKLPIITLKNNSTNATTNLNFGVFKCSGTYIKILFQDDLLKNLNYLELCVTDLEQNRLAWGLVTTSQNYNFDLSLILKENKPKYSSRMLQGKNFFGSPSNITFRKSTFLPFSNRLVYSYDCEWYTRMVHNWGMPIYETRLTTIVRIHKFQETNYVKHFLQSDTLIAQEMHDSRYINELNLKFFNKKISCKCKLIVQTES